MFYIVNIVSLPIRHEISCIKNDWGKHKEEENIWGEC